jgi:hypothetical protein
MSVKRLLIAALVAAMMLAASAFAQKNELTGIIGRTFISDQVCRASASPTTTCISGTDSPSRRTTGVF